MANINIKEKDKTSTTYDIKKFLDTDSNQIRGALQTAAYDINTGTVIATNVGIGGTPNYKLTVIGGDIRVEDGQKYRGGSGNEYIQMTDASGDGFKYFHDDVERFRITNAGNVGIGTSSPDANLEVYNATDSEIYIGTGNAGDSKLTFGEGGTKNFLFTYDGGDNKMYISSSDVANVMTMDRATGNVGIGITSPGAKLEVAGGVEITTATDHLKFSIANGTNKWIQYLSSDDLRFYNTGAAQVTFQDGGNVGIGTTSPSAPLHVNGDIRGSGWFESQYNLDLNAGYDLTGNEQINFNINDVQKAVILNNGNFGIGASSPEASFHVKRDDAPNSILGYFDSTATGANAAAIVDIRAQDGTDTSAILRFRNDADYWMIGINTDDKFAIESRFASDFSAPAFTIDQSGNVGIGTSSPGAKLDVNGQGIFGSVVEVGDAGFGASYGVMAHPSRFSTTDYSFMSDSTGTTYVNAKTGSAINFRINNSDKVSIDTNGNVGIGTTAPDEKLDVVGAMTWSGVRTSNFASQGTLDYNSGESRLFSFGPDATTRGQFSIKLLESDGGSEITPITINEKGRVYITQPTDDTGLYLASNATTNPMQRFYTNAVRTGVTDNAMLHMNMENASATGDMIYTKNDGSGPTIKIAQTQDVEVLDFDACTDGGTSHTTVAGSLKVQMPDGTTGYMNFYT